MDNKQLLQEMKELKMDIEYENKGIDERNTEVLV